MAALDKLSSRSNFRHFFLRGLAIALPTLLTLWILSFGYTFVQDKIAGPINTGVKALVLWATPYPVAAPAEVAALEREQEAKGVAIDPDQIRYQVRSERLEKLWTRYKFPLDLIGLVLAIAAICTAGLLLGNLFGARVVTRGEGLLLRVPFVRNVYPSVKQVTDFLVGGSDKKMQFSRVVAVEYPRKGLWSVALVTGETIRPVQEKAGRPCLTVFVPSSPTPFTGYVATVPQEDTIELPMSIEEALRFLISGGVIVPPGLRSSQPPEAPEPPALEGAPAGTAVAKLAAPAPPSSPGAS